MRMVISDDRDWMDTMAIVDFRDHAATREPPGSKARRVPLADKVYREQRENRDILVNEVGMVSLDVARTLLISPQCVVIVAIPDPVEIKA